MRGRIGSLLIVALVIAGLSAPVAAAQEATPTADFEPLDLPGYETGAGRAFLAADEPLYGTYALVIDVEVFDGEEHASDAVPMIMDHFIAVIHRDYIVSGWHTAAPRAIGDERIAQLGQVARDGADKNRIIMAILIVRDGARVYVGIGAAVSGYPLADLTTTIDAILGREVGGDATPIAADGMRTGGVWDLLPRLDDVPEGMVFDHESGSGIDDVVGDATPAG